MNPDAFVVMLAWWRLSCYFRMRGHKNSKRCHGIVVWMFEKPHPSCWWDSDGCVRWNTKTQIPGVTFTIPLKTWKQALSEHLDSRASDGRDVIVAVILRIQDVRWSAIAFLIDGPYHLIMWWKSPRLKSETQRRVSVQCSDVATSDDIDMTFRILGSPFNQYISVISPRWWKVGLLNKDGISEHVCPTFNKLIMRVMQLRFWHLRRQTKFNGHRLTSQYWH